jgi:hypothetical protein
MRLILVGAVALTSCSPFHTGDPPPPNVRVAEYRGGQWFDGTTFTARTMYVVGDVFRVSRPARVDTVVDLAGRYVVAPFGDAHVHFVEPNAVDQYVAMFLRDGIFYVKDQSGAPMLSRAILPKVNRPTSVDFLAANQGWTSPGGHPVEIIKQGAQMGLITASYLADSLDYGAAMLVDTPADVDRHWPVFLASQPKPDFVKVYLLVSEEHARRRHDPRMEGYRGLDPALVPLIVQRAHAAGLHVSAHVSTAADFRAAVASGVDQLAHLPGQRSNAPAPYLLTDADAASAAARGVKVIMTVAMRNDSALTDRIMREVYAPNIRVLRRAGVQLFIGSDIMRGTAVTEIAALARSGLFTNLDLLRMWSVETPRLIFPHRKIGELRDGYEASFLALSGSPLENIGNTRRIALRVKQGVTLP